MLLAIVTIFIIGYLAIALEHPLRIDKAAVALLLGMLLWVLYAFGAESIVPVADAEELSHYLASSTTLQIRDFIFLDRSYDNCRADRCSRRFFYHN